MRMVFLLFDHSDHIEGHLNVKLANTPRGEIYVLSRAPEKTRSNIRQNPKEPSVLRFCVGGLKLLLLDGNVVIKLDMC